MRKIILAIVILATAASAALAAPLNAQRIAGGGLFPVYVNGTGTKQSMARYVYTDQTQFTPNPLPPTRMLLGVGK